MPRLTAILVAAIPLGLTGCPREPATMSTSRPTVEAPALTDTEAPSRSAATDDDVANRKQQDVQKLQLQDAPIQ